MNRIRSQTISMSKKVRSHLDPMSKVSEINGIQFPKYGISNEFVFNGSDLE